MFYRQHLRLLVRRRTRAFSSTSKVFSVKPPTHLTIHLATNLTDSAPGHLGRREGNSATARVTCVGDFKVVLRLLRDFLGAGRVVGQDANGALVFKKDLVYVQHNVLAHVRRSSPVQGSDASSASHTDLLVLGCVHRSPIRLCLGRWGGGVRGRSKYCT